VTRVKREGPGRHTVPVAILFLLTGALGAQVPEDQILSERVLSPQAEIDQAIAESRFHLGPVRLSPEVSIRDVTYDNNVYGTSESPRGDFRATVSAGLGLILPIASNVFLRAGISPAYTWYAELKERRFFGGSTSASFLVFANRLTLEGAAGAAKEDVIFSSEAQGRVIRNLGTIRLSAELRLFARLYLYGSGAIQRFRFTGPGAEGAIFDPSQTDRTDQSVRAELRYRLSEDVRVAAGYEETRAEFVSTPQQYDNRTRTVVGTIYYDRQSFFLHASGGYSDQKPINGSTVPTFSGLTGSSFASYALLSRLDVLAFANRGVSYGLASPYYIATRYGGGVVFKVGWRLKLQGSASLGSDRYTTPVSSAGQVVDRKDDIKSYGGGFDFLFSSRIQMKFIATESRYTSNVLGNDRSFFRFFGTLSYGGNLLR
jgi:hypothetical protein